MSLKVQISAKMTSKNQITVLKNVWQKLGLKENQRVIFEFTPENGIKLTGGKVAPSFEDFWKTERTIVEKNGKFDTEGIFFGEDLSEEKFEW